MNLRSDKREALFLVLEAHWSERIEDHASVRPFIEGLWGVNSWEQWKEKR